MVKRSNSDIQNEWRTLRQMKRQIPRMSAWRPRTNQHDAIDAMISALRYDMSLPEIKAQYQDEAQGAAEDARYWADGGDILSPTKLWASVVLQHA